MLCGVTLGRGCCRGRRRRWLRGEGLGTSWGASRDRRWLRVFSAWSSRSDGVRRHTAYRPASPAPFPESTPPADATVQEAEAVPDTQPGCPVHSANDQEPPCLPHIHIHLHIHLHTIHLHTIHPHTLHPHTLHPHTGPTTTLILILIQKQRRKQRQRQTDRQRHRHLETASDEYLSASDEQPWASQDGSPPLSPTRRAGSSRPTLVVRHVGQVGQVGHVGHVRQHGQQLRPVPDSSPAWHGDGERQGRGCGLFLLPVGGLGHTRVPGEGVRMRLHRTSREMQLMQLLHGHTTRRHECFGAPRDAMLCVETPSTVLQTAIASCVGSPPPVSASVSEAPSAVFQVSNTPLSLPSSLSSFSLSIPSILAFPSSLLLLLLLLFLLLSSSSPSLHSFQRLPTPSNDFQRLPTTLCVE